MAFVRAKKREPVGEAGLFEYAVGMLARRMRTERDLRRLMRGRAEEGEVGVRAVDAAVGRLKELGYLSDERFAEGYARVRKESEKLGRRRVQQDLVMKGVGKGLVAATVEAAYEGVDEVALAREYIARKRMKQPGGENAQKETVRAMNRLLRAGFSSWAVYKVLQEWDVPEELMEVAGVDEMEEGAGDSDGYSRQNEKE
ncbi:MAG: regulatory protein RecX [Edaphobacter sp.]